MVQNLYGLDSNYCLTLCNRVFNINGMMSFKHEQICNMPSLLNAQVCTSKKIMGLVKFLPGVLLCVMKLSLM